MTKKYQLYLPSIFDGGIFVDSVFLSASSQLIETHLMNITVSSLVQWKQLGFLSICSPVLSRCTLILLKQLCLMTAVHVQAYNDSLSFLSYFRLVM